MTRPSALNSEIRDVNVAAAVALSVALFCLVVCLGIVLTPMEDWSTNSFTGWLVVRFGAWLPILGWALVGLALVGSIWRENRLFAGLVTATLVFVFWAVAPVVAARQDAIAPPTVLGLGIYAWFAGVCLFCAVRIWRVRHKERSRP